MNDKQLKDEMQKDAAMKLASAQKLVKHYSEQVFAATLAFFLVLSDASGTAQEFGTEFVKTLEAAEAKAKELLGICEDAVKIADAYVPSLYLLALVATDSLGRELLDLELKVMQMQVDFA